MLDFRQSIHLAWIIDSSLLCIWCSDSLLCLMCHTALLLLIFITFCVPNNIVSYDQSNRVIKVDAFDCRWAFCGEPRFHSIVIVVPLHLFKIFSSSQKVNSLPEKSALRFVIVSVDLWDSRRWYPMWPHAEQSGIFAVEILSIYSAQVLLIIAPL
jgi:hypothetical protein